MNLAFPKDDEPSSLEKSNQLERIVLSDTFQRLEKPAKLLRRLVADHLAGVEPEEHRLGIEVFDRRQDWITEEDSVVRQNLTRLRKLLDSYYATEGLEDRLNLKIPGYKTHFTYNPRHPFERVFRPALRYLASHPKTAFALLDAALSLEPNHAEALAARAETELWRPMTGNALPILDLLEAAEIQARQALQYDKKCWRAYVVLGAICCCRREWKSAGKHFASAVASSPEEAQLHPWYAAFLMATRCKAQALELARARASAPSETAWPLLTYAIFLYVSREFDKAKRAVLDAKQRYEDTWLSHVVWSCICLAQGAKKPSVPLLGMSLPQTLADGTPVYTALSFAEHLSRLARDDADHTLVQELTREWLCEKEAALAAGESEKEPPSIAEIRVSPFHLAIGHIAIGNAEKKAIELLAQDVYQNHPMMAWLHLWPIFDPLRTSKEYQRLVADRKLLG